MDRRGMPDLGKEIKDIIQNSMNSMDFNKLNKDVGNKVNTTIEEVRKVIQSIQVEGQRYKTKPNPQPLKNNRDDVKQPIKNPTVLVPNVPVGKVAGTLLTVFGSIGIGVFGTGAVVLGILSSVNQTTNVFKSIVIGLLLFFGVSVLMEVKGSHLRKRLKRFRRYLSLFYGRNNCTIKELSAYSGLSERFLVKDLRKMMSIGMFPQAHIDNKKTFIMLNRGSYEQYLKGLEDIRAQQLDEQQNNRQLKKTKDSRSSNVEKELWSAIEEGKSYILQIKAAKDSIHDDGVAKKLFRMEVVVGKILDYVELHPEQLHEIRKFMEYYMPTTLKLLNAYKEFEYQTIQGENIRTAKSEIQNTLDTINLAFENLLDGLYENAAWDVSTDISVLETMLAQEGLTEKDF